MPSEAERVLQQLRSVLGGDTARGKGGGKGGKRGGGGGYPWSREAGGSAGQGDDPNLLAGPRLPLWGCAKCGEAANWANRLACRRCNARASQGTQDKARAAAKQVA